MSPRARWTPADIGEPHVVAACWALLTGSYGAHILSLWMTHAQPPGLSTVTAAGAVMAVWLYFPIHYRSRLRPGPPRAFRRPRAALLMVLALVVILEWNAVFQDLVRQGTLRPIPAVTAFAFTFVFRHLLLDLLADAGRPGRPGA